MAQVHPSRAALIPQTDSRHGLNDRDSWRDREYAGKSRGRSRSHSPPPRRSPSPRRRRERSKEHQKDHSFDRREIKRSDGQRHDRSRSPPNRGQRSRSRDGRNSPSYEAYRQRKASGEQDSGLSGQPQNNWQRNYQQGSGYTAGPNSGGQRYRNDAGAGGSVFFEERRRRRDAMTLNVWPPSPKAPARSLSPDGHRHRDKYSSKDKGRNKGKRQDKRRDWDDIKKKRKRSRSPSSASETGSSEEERRREKRRRRDRDRERGSRSREHRSRRNSASPASPQKPVDEITDEMEAETLWIEKKHVANTMPLPPVPASATAVTLTSSAKMNEDDDEIGPMPPQKTKDRIDEREYGGALLRGEGSAMAAFLQDNARIPRRGEIGLTSDEIAQYEDVGYVMSGSRHRRMNAVRMRKENQVISAEEKRSILKLQKEERERREELLKAEFRELVDEQLGNIGAARK